jgi:hypothetical protein
VLPGLTSLRSRELSEGRRAETKGEGGPLGRASYGWQANEIKGLLGISARETAPLRLRLTCGVVSTCKALSARQGWNLGPAEVARADAGLVTRDHDRALDDGRFHQASPPSMPC